MITTAICDDEDNTRLYLASLVEAQPYPCEIVEYASAAGCLADRRKIDLLFLDIELNAAGGLDGMALARKIRERDPSAQPVIVFIVGYDRYVRDTLDIGEFRYLLKPVKEEKFAQVFARTVRQIEAGREKGNCTLALPSAHTGRTVPLDSLYYIESRNHQVMFHLKSEAFTWYAKIEDLEAELSERFFRIHKGYLVNLSYVKSYSGTEVTLTNGDRLPLSKDKYQDFVEAYLRFLRQR